MLQLFLFLTLLGYVYSDTALGQIEVDLNYPIDSLMKLDDILILDTENQILNREPYPLEDTLHPTIYLTFDDGPHKGTFIVSKISYEQKIPVSFFMVGLHHKEASPTLLKKYNKLLLYNPYTQILNHSYTHGFRNHYSIYYTDVEGAFNDILKNQIYLNLRQKIVRLPGVNVWRTPQIHQEYAFKNRVALSDRLVHKGYSILGWDDEWHFNYKTLELNRNAYEMERLITKYITSRKTKLPNHFILLTHERSFSTTKGKKELKLLIKLLKAKGYRFAFASNHPSLSARSSQD